AFLRTACPAGYAGDRPARRRARPAERPRRDGRLRGRLRGARRVHVRAGAARTAVPRALRNEKWCQTPICGERCLTPWLFGGAELLEVLTEERQHVLAEALRNAVDVIAFVDLERVLDAE